MKAHSPMRTRILTCIFGAAFAGSTFAALTDISDAPLGSQQSDQVRPNIMFILDDSGSMDWRYMPDNTSTSTVGYRSNSCNSIYYNRDTDYEIPKGYDSTPLRNSAQTTFSSAYINGYGEYMSSSGGTTILSSNFSADGIESGRAAYYWNLSNPTTDTSGTTLTPKTGACNVDISGATSANTGVCCTTRADKDYNTCSNPSFITSPAACPGGKTLVWTKTLVSNNSGPNSVDERQNFANWYSYYRIRMYMMKAATGRAFANITDNYRLGFMTIHPGTFNTDGNANGSNADSDKFLKMGDFTTAHRQAWFSKLYSQSTTGATPLRTALSVAGRYYAGKNDSINQGMIPTQADDPVQYSCQQNFSILTTDGYWNNGNSRDLGGSSSLSNQDGNISELDAYNPTGTKLAMSPRPIYDGASATYVYNTASNVYRNVSCVFSSQLQTRTDQTQRCQTPLGNVEKRTRATTGSAWSAWSNAGGTCQYGSLTDCRNGQLERFRNGNWQDDNGCRSGTPGSETCRRTDNAYSCPGNDWANDLCTNSNTATLPVCRSLTGVWANAASCSSSGPDASGVTIQCQSLDTYGSKIQYRATTTAKTYSGPGQSGTQIGNTQTTTGSYTDLDGTCYASAPTLPTNGTVTGIGPPSPPLNCLSGSQVWPCETGSSTGGSSNTLADVAQYYYKTDLRPGDVSVPITDPLYGSCPGSGALGGTLDVCRNNVPASGTGVEDDRANWQHMTTFTMGLGLSGTLSYSPTYKTDSSGTFDSIRKGNTNWPVPSGDDPTALDDLWHAAVNGRGTYFSAKDPDSVVTGLTKALSGISAITAAASAAATSNLEPVSGDNFAYMGQYRTQRWDGDLLAREIDPQTGAIQTAIIWSAQAKLDTMTKAACDSRNIYLFRSGATNNMVEFKWNTFACDVSGNPTGTAVTSLDGTEQANFSSTQINLLSQYPNMGDGNSGTANQRAEAVGANLVNYLRGQRSKEGFTSNPLTNTDLNKLYRARDHVFGDLVSSQPVYVRAPFSQYTDNGYTIFKSNKGGRTPMIYAGANDGMLHAFYAGVDVTDINGGKEAWAFMPSVVLPNLYKLASENYASAHQFFVDGTVTASDVFDKTASTDCGQATPASPADCWKTIIVGGMNKGGKGYYALDVTDPASPKALWEFKWSSTCYNTASAATKAATSGADCKLGYTYGKPLVAKLQDGTWAAFVSSGYNNDDGQGYLYVLDAITGKIIYRIGTGVGTASSPSGLNQLAGWVENSSLNNTVTRVYGVDLLGNIWRFDVNDILNASGREATLVAQVVDSTGTPQSITTKPRLAEISSEPFIYVGTGRFLGLADKSDTQQQTIWAIKDPLGATAVTGLRSNLGQRVLTNVGSGSAAIRTMSTSSCQTGDGWYIDLPDSGERMNIDMQIQLGTLLAASNVPTTNACDSGGYSWLNYFNAKTGCPVSGVANVGVRLVSSTGNAALAVGVNLFSLASGATGGSVILGDGGNTTVPNVFSTPGPQGKRVTWREIVQ